MQKQKRRKDNTSRSLRRKDWSDNVPEKAPRVKWGGV